MDTGSKSVIGAIDKVAQEVAQDRTLLIDALNRIAAGVGGLFEVPRAATSDPREEVLIRYTVGTGEFSDDMQYNKAVEELICSTIQVNPA